MITETAYMSIQPGREADFEAAIAVARELVEVTPGCRGLTVQRGIERPEVYLVTIQWDTLEDHLVGFRESSRFPRWRELLSPHYSEPPAVEHWTPVDSSAE
ncbi:MAG: antibiotic biosynthesis monooxygenase [Actinobacteria bacterium]|nr:antibiotic biosynthesis monooxygenase [Actinomycetota bacterium]